MNNHPYSRDSPLAVPQRLSPARTRPHKGSAQEWRENGAHNGAPNGRGERPPSRASASQRPASGSSCQACLPVRRAPRPPPRAVPGRAGAVHRGVARRCDLPGSSPVAHHYRVGAPVAAHPQRIPPIGSRRARSPRRSHYTLADGGVDYRQGLAGADGHRGTTLTDGGGSRSAGFAGGGVTAPSGRPETLHHDRSERSPGAPSLGDPRTLGEDVDEAPGPRSAGVAHTGSVASPTGWGSTTPTATRCRAVAMTPSSRRRAAGASPSVSAVVSTRSATRDTRARTVRTGSLGSLDAARKQAKRASTAASRDAFGSRDYKQPHLAATGPGMTIISASAGSSRIVPV